MFKNKPTSYRYLNFGGKMAYDELDDEDEIEEKDDEDVLDEDDE